MVINTAERERSFNSRSDPIENMPNARQKAKRSIPENVLYDVDVLVKNSESRQCKVFVRQDATETEQNIDFGDGGDSNVPVSPALFTETPPRRHGKGVLEGSELSPTESLVSADHSHSKSRFTSSFKSYGGDESLLRSRSYEIKTFSNISSVQKIRSGSHPPYTSETATNMSSLSDLFGTYDFGKASGSKDMSLVDSKIGTEIDHDHLPNPAISPINPSIRSEHKDSISPPYSTVTSASISSSQSSRAPTGSVSKVLSSQKRTDFSHQRDNPLLNSNSEIRNDDAIRILKSSDDSMVTARLHDCSHDSQNDHMRLPCHPIANISYVHGAYKAAAPFMVHNQKWMTILRKLMPEEHADVVRILIDSSQSSSQKSHGMPSVDPVRLIQWAEHNPVVAAYGIMKSDGGRIEHPDMNDTDLSVSCSSVGIRRKSTMQVENDEVSLLSQNSPRGQENKKVLPAIEWDIFLDPYLVRQVDKAMQIVDVLKVRNDDDREAQLIAAEVDVDRQIGRLTTRMMLAHGTTSQLVAEAVGFNSRFNFSRVVEQSESRRLHRRKIKPKSDDAYMHDTKRITSAAHMEVSQSTIPETGPLDEDGIEVEGMPSSGAAGLFIHRWLALFAKALNLSIKEDAVVSGSDLFSFDHGVDYREDEKFDNDDDITQMPPSLCGLFLCLGMDDPNSLKADHSRSSMMKSTELIRKILRSPLRIVMDLKSRRVPPRVWGRLVDNLRSRGLVVDGLCSFDICELRSISSFSCSPVKAIILFHSAGDLQKACIANEIKPGDTVYFNAGSLLLKKRYSIMEAASIGCCQRPPENIVGYDTNMDLDEMLTLFQPFAFAQHEREGVTGQVECKSTIEDFQKKYDLKIGVYIQEFCISRDVLNSVVQFINAHPSIYNLGIAWGGINGSTVNGLSGDGYWKQRYVGTSWNFSVEPPAPVKMLEAAPDSLSDLEPI